MEKKKMTNKKKFWIGMASLAAVGIITATVAYFSSTASFNKDTLKSLGYKVTSQKLLDAEAAKNMINGQTLDAEVSVTNDGEIPVLTRIYYTFSDKNEVNAQRGVKLTADNLAPFVPNIKDGESSKFVYNDDDNYYYYLGALSKDNGVATHLQSLSLTGYDASSGDDIYYAKGKGESGEIDWTDNNITNIVTKTGEKKVFTSNNFEKELQVRVETIQATDRDGKLLTEDGLKEGNVITVGKIKDAWSNLTNPSQPEEGV